MAWLAEPSENGTITENVSYVTENLWICFDSVDHWQRTRTITQKRYVGLTQGAAETQAASSSETTNCVDAHTEATGGGSYAALETIESYTDWALVAPAAPAPGRAAPRAFKKATKKGG